MVLASFTMPVEWDCPLFNVILCPILSYLTILIGLTKMPSIPVFRRGDYSYGIYLYGYPIQQLVVLLGFDRLVWWQNSLLSVPLITLFAAFSWHVVEWPILRQRKNLSVQSRLKVAASAQRS
jgi:peptidoglycan/LPS O-acetylase OafA/YrhL